MIKNASTISRVVLLATLVASWCGVLAAVRAQQPLFSVEGIVVDSETGQPLDGVRVSIAGELLASPTAGRGSATAPALSFPSLTPTGPARTLDASTNRDGLFGIQDIPAGNYRLTGKKDGYVDARVEGRKLPGNPGIPFTIGLGQPPTQVRMKRSGTFFTPGHRSGQLPALRVAWLNGPAYRNSDFIKDYEGKGTPVRIESRGRITVNLAVFEIR